MHSKEPVVGEGEMRATKLEEKKPQSRPEQPQQPFTLLSLLTSVLFLISSALIVFAAFRNTLTW